MERSKLFKTISTVITSCVFAYLVYLVIRFAVVYGPVADLNLEKLEERNLEIDALLAVIPVFSIPFLASFVWAIIQRRFWWIPAFACIPLFTGIFCVGGVGMIIGLLGLIIVPFICCMIMIWTTRGFLHDGDCVGEYKEYQYYGQDLW